VIRAFGAHCHNPTSRPAPVVGQLNKANLDPAGKVARIGAYSDYGEIRPNRLFSGGKT